MRANDVADVVLQHVSNPTAVQLQKLLYYSQAWHLAITDRPLFEDEVEAWVDGPVIEDVWRERKSMASRQPQAGRRVDLSPTAEAIIELVCAEYGSRQGDELSALTHTEQPWLRARASLAPEKRSRRRIDRQDMAEFYRQHRQLGGRSAEDLAAVGVYIRDPWSDDGALDVDALLEELDFDDSAVPTRSVVAVNGEPFPEDVSLKGIRRKPRRKSS